MSDLEGAIKFRQRCIISEKQNLGRLNASDSAKDYTDDALSPTVIDEFQNDMVFTESDESQNECDTVSNSGVDTESCISEEVKEFASFKVPKPVSRAGPYMCDDCGRSINHWTNFQEHKLRHTGIKDFKCQYK